MANDDHVALLKKGLDAWKKGVDVWNAWRNENSTIHLDLMQRDLKGEDLSRANLSGADLTEAFLRGAKLIGATKLRGTDLIDADLSDANLSGADLTGAKLIRAKLIGAKLGGANLTHAVLVDTNLTDADLTGCRVYGGAAWNLTLDGAKQQNLIITQEKEPEITVDNIEVAQFIYLLLHNEKIRDVIDTIGKKGVLLLGRFTKGRMEVLERLREELRERDFLPIIFNFDNPETKNFTETVRLLAGMSRFVIVDITNPRSAPWNYRRLCRNAWSRLFRSWTKTKKKSPSP
jgi:hypothetical protein